MIVLTDQNFEEEIGKSQLPVLVDFWASWCGPCRMMEPIIEEVAKTFDGKLMVGKLDVDANQASAVKFQILSIPTLIFFKNGSEVKRLSGYKDKVLLVEDIQKVIAA